MSWKDMEYTSNITGYLPEILLCSGPYLPFYSMERQMANPPRCRCATIDTEFPKRSSRYFENPA